MSDRQRIAAVEAALDRHAELIAKTREAYQVLIDEDYANFSTGGMLGFRPHCSSHDTMKQAEATLGREAVEQIWYEEMNKFGVGKNSEVWSVYSSGTDEERAALENKIAEDYYKAPEALHYWGCEEFTTKYGTVHAVNYSEETDISYRRDYAAKFYGEMRP